jgi:hypothetical protein
MVQTSFCLRLKLAQLFCANFYFVMATVYYIPVKTSFIRFVPMLQHIVKGYKMGGICRPITSMKNTNDYTFLDAASSSISKEN